MNTTMATEERLAWLREFVSTNGPGRKILQLRKGDVLFEQGTKATHLYRVLRGQIKLVTVSAATGRSVTNYTCRMHQWVFEGAIDAQRNYLHSAIAMTDSSLISFPRTEFPAMMLVYPYLSLTFGVELASQLDEIHLVLEDQALIPADRRLARALLAEFAQNSVPVLRLETTPSRIGDLIGRSRMTGHRVIDRFVALGILTKMPTKLGRETTYQVHRRALEEFLADYGEHQ